MCSRKIRIHPYLLRMLRSSMNRFLSKSLISSAFTLSMIAFQATVVLAAECPPGPPPVSCKASCDTATELNVGACTLSAPNLNQNGVCCQLQANGSAKESDQAHAGGSSVWPPNPYTYQNPLGTVKIGDLIARIIGQILPIVGALFWALMMYGGFLWLTAGEDNKRIDKARTTITNGAIGMAIVLGAYLIVTTIIGTLGKSLGQ